MVLFSPSGGKELFRALGWWMVDEEREEEGEDGGKVRVRRRRREERLEEGEEEGKGGGGGVHTYIACIGPTTRDYLASEFGFEADVCAERPSAEGVKEGIEKFMRAKGIR